MTSNKNYVLSISIIGVLFFIFGFVTWLNGTLIPFLKLACDLKTDAEALLVTFAFYMAYFFLAIPSSFILTKTGFKKGMSLGLAVMAVGALLFLPAAMQRSFSLFLTGLFVQGMGLALLQTASNPYISVIGPIESAAKRISIMGICNKVAGALSPLILGAIVLQDATGIEGQINATTDLATKTGLLQALSERVIVPYAIMAAVLIALAVMIWLSPLPEIETDGSTTIDNKTKYKNIFQVPYLMLGILCLFLYVGVEVMAGDVIGTYGKAIGIGLDETKVFTSYTLWSMVVGYIIGILTIPKYIKQQNALALSAIAGIVLSLGVFFTTGYTSIVFIALLGFANALMWPAIFPLAIENLGKFTKLGSALLVMGIAGGAVLPQLYARIVPTLGPPSAFFWIVAPCYAYILFYATKGHMLGKR
ncbi:MAG: sugar MFS transporter [Flammeovirgaceae bacterium]|jgi:FHS family L-fucose permease-like MFS transporter|nr:sugar MFS transporter [Flammeovirgaceae bacterium]